MRLRLIAFLVLLFSFSVSEASLCRVAKVNWRSFFEKKQEEPSISPDCEVMIDGRKAKLEDLRPGMHARFIVENGIIIRIIAITEKK